jgi:hypothetical protein
VPQVPIYGEPLCSELLPTSKRTRPSNLLEVRCHVFDHTLGLLELFTAPAPLAFGRSRKSSSALISPFHVGQSNVVLPDLMVGPDLENGETALPEAANWLRSWIEGCGRRGRGGVIRGNFFHLLIAGVTLKIVIFIQW